MRKRAKKARRSRSATPEGLVLRSIQQYLLVRQIWSIRMNTGFLQSKGGSWVRFGGVGMADVLASPDVPIWFNPGDPTGFVLVPHYLWIECKSARGKQTPDQLAFQKIVQDNGHAYIVARSIDDVEAWLKKNGVK